MPARRSLLIPIIGFIFGDVLRDGAGARTTSELGRRSPERPAPDAGRRLRSLGESGAGLPLPDGSTDGYEQLEGGARHRRPTKSSTSCRRSSSSSSRCAASPTSSTATPSSASGFGATTDLRNDLYERTLRPVGALPRRAPVGRAGQPRRPRRRRPAVGDLDPAGRPRPAVGDAARAARDADVDPLPAGAVLPRSPRPSVLYPIVRFSKGMRRTSHRAQERTADLANLVSRVGARPPRGQGLRHGGLRERSASARRRGGTCGPTSAGQMIANLSSPVIETLGVFGAGAFLVFAGRAVQSGAMAVGDAGRLPVQPLRDVRPDPQAEQGEPGRPAVAGRGPAPPQPDGRCRSTIVDRPGARRDRDASSGDPLRGRPLRLRPSRGAARRRSRGAARRGRGVRRARRAAARPRSPTCCRGSSTSPAGGSRSTASTSAIFSLADLRALIGLVTQETVLFNDTVRNNIAYGREDLPLEQVRAGRPGGVRRRVHRRDARGLRHDRGGGRRAAVGRTAAAHRDRARAAQERADPDPRRGDLAARHRVRVPGPAGALEPDAGAAPRWSSRTGCRPWRARTGSTCVENGRIVEQGSHDELLRDDGIYRRLYELQFRE